MFVLKVCLLVHIHLFLYENATLLPVSQKEEESKLIKGRSIERGRQNISYIFKLDHTCVQGSYTIYVMSNPHISSLTQ